MTIGLFWVITIAAVGAVRFAPFIPARYRVPLSIAVALGFFIWAPFALDGFRAAQMSRICVWAIVIMGLNILTGYNGQISLGHGALMAFGAYTAAILMDGSEQVGFLDADPWPFWAAIIFAGGLTALLGVLLGVPALRLSGPYLAIATLALVISFPQIIRKYDDFTGGGLGIRVGRTQPPDFLGDLLDLDEWLYFLTLTVAVMMFLLAWGILRGPLGRAFVAVRDSEVAAAAMGIDVARTKVTAFTISAFYAGVAGALFTQITGTITPESISIVESINFLVAIVIGGLASMLGAVIGAVAIIYLPFDGPELVGSLPGLSGDVVQSAPGAIQGLLVIVVILIMPRGVAGFIHRLTRLRASDVIEGVRSIPAAVAARMASIGDGVVELRESLPWSRLGNSSQTRGEGGDS